MGRVDFEAAGVFRPDFAKGLSGVVITEAAAICCYLADVFPQKLNVPLSDPRRGPYFKWLFFGPSVLQPAIIDRAHPRRIAELSASPASL